MNTILKPDEALILTVNGGSSSIKWALFSCGFSTTKVLFGLIEKIGLPDATWSMNGQASADNFVRKVSAPEPLAATRLLMDWIEAQDWKGALTAVGHRVVHGGPKYWNPRIIDAEMITELRHMSPFDPDHLPGEILLAETFRHRFPELPQVACFDTDFHHNMPRLARLLPIPRLYDEKGLRRYGFHGLSCSYLIKELERVAGPGAGRGRVLIAHLGNGASVTAVRDGKSVDTTMSFSPTAGLPMGTRSGDLDPSLSWYLEQTEKMTAKQFHHMVNHESGLLGVSQTTSDMRQLLAAETEDPRAAEAVDLFCYETKKRICALSGALGDLDTLVFSGGIGENSPVIRSRICRNLEFLGIALDEGANTANAGLISQPASKVSVRVLRTDEELEIARTVCQILGIDMEERHGNAVQEY